MAVSTIMLNEYFVREDGRKADVALTPGELVELKSDGDWQAHSTAGDKGMAAFVMENDLAGEGIATDITAGDVAPVGIAQTGCKVYAWLDTTSGNAVIGSPLESTGNGNLRVHVPQADTAATGSPTIRVGQIIGYAEEAVTAPGSGRSRITIRVA